MAALVVPGAGGTRGTAPPTPEKLCALLPAGWTVDARDSTDTTVFCRARSGELTAEIYYSRYSGDDLCEQQLSGVETWEGTSRRIALGDCGLVRDWGGGARPARTAFFLIFDGPEFYYQVRVDALGEPAPTEDVALGPAREIEGLIRAAMGSSPPAPVAPPSGATRTGLPLCAEARVLLEGFGEERLAAAGIQDPMRTSILMDDDFLVPDFQTAIRNHNERYPNETAYVGDSLEQVSTLVWMFSNGGILPDSVTRRFITGQEAALERAIVRRVAEKTGQGAAESRLSPGEVFELALELSGGDANTAMLTAHNALRGIGRGDGTGGMLGVNGPNPEFFTDHLAPVRGAADNVGPWYHMFGTAYMEMVSRGDWSPYLAATGAVATGLLSAPVGLVIAGGAVLWQSEVNTEGSAGSRVYNGLEQVYREQLSGQAPDPEKFCFNVWGAQIGNLLYESLPYRGTRGFSDPPFSDFSPPDTEMPNFDAIRSLADARFAHIVRSPFSIEWQESGAAMVLDQEAGLESARLLGGLPFPAFFFPEEETWAVVWFSSDASDRRVAFEAMEPGAELHYDRLDLQTGEAATYTATALDRGQRWEIPRDGADGPPELAGPDGRLVSPTVRQIDLPREDNAVGAGETPIARDPLVGLVAIGCLSVLCLGGAAAIGGATFLGRRKPAAAAKAQP